jgi:RNA polymerase sigma factor (sigma-70 family)
MIHYTDEAIVQGIKFRDSSIIGYIYKEYYPTIKYLISTNSGSESDAEDVFQDALIILYKKIIEENLILTSSFKTFLYSICRNLWLQRLDKKVFSNEFLELENISAIQETIYSEFSDTEDEKFKLYQVHFLNLSEDCQKILRLFMNKVALKEIAEIMGFKTEKYAKTRKFMCKEKLRNAILNDPKSKKFLTSYE